MVFGGTTQAKPSEAISTLAPTRLVPRSTRVSHTSLMTPMPRCQHRSQDSPVERPRLACQLRAPIKFKV